MKNESLDKLFDNLSSKNTTMEEDNWDEFEVRLHKKMFYKFSWNRFNIFYLTTISLSLLTNAFLLVAFMNLSQDHIENRKEILLYSDSIKFHDSVILKTGENTSYKKEQLKIVHSSLLKNDSAVMAIQIALKDSVNVNAIKSAAIDTIKTPIKPVVIKRKSIVYISKRDTIINIDTVKVKKRR
jgi:hypothetical protein